MNHLNPLLIHNKGREGTVLTLVLLNQDIFSSENSVYPDPDHLISICTVCHAASEYTVILIGPVKQK